MSKLVADDGGVADNGGELTWGWGFLQRQWIHVGEERLPDNGEGGHWRTTVVTWWRTGGVGVVGLVFW